MCTRDTGELVHGHLQIVKQIIIYPRYGWEILKGRVRKFMEKVAFASLESWESYNR